MQRKADDLRSLVESIEAKMQARETTKLRRRYNEESSNLAAATKRLQAARGLAPIAVFSTLFTDEVLGNAKLAGFSLTVTAVISLGRSMSMPTMSIATHAFALANGANMSASHVGPPRCSTSATA